MFSPSVPSAATCPCAHAAAKASALRVPDQAAGGCGSRQRSSPTGGAAKGIPRNTCRPSSSVPSSRPPCTWTVAAAAPKAAEPANNSASALLRMPVNLLLPVHLFCNGMTLYSPLVFRAAFPARDGRIATVRLSCRPEPLLASLAGTRYRKEDLCMKTGTLLAAASLWFLAAFSNAQPAVSAGAAVLPPTNDYAGFGPFATITEPNTGPDGTYTIVRPENLGQGGLVHALIAFGPGIGGPMDSMANLLQRIASHGFVIIGRQLDGGPRNPENNRRMIAGLDWLIAQNSVAGSVFQNRLDVDNAA